MMRGGGDVERAVRWDRLLARRAVPTHRSRRQTGSLRAAKISRVAFERFSV
jgi:hypothetical protein